VNKNREKEESYFAGLVFFCGQASTVLFYGKKIKIIGLGSLGIYGKKRVILMDFLGRAGQVFF
jgi:hypothetical protein